MPESTRSALGLQGLMPPKVESLDVQKKRALLQLRSKSTDMEKYMFMATLRNTNTTLFYKLVCDELEVIYHWRWNIFSYYGMTLFRVKQKF